MIRFVHGFVAGAVAMLVFHQGAILALHLLGIVPNPPWSLRPTAPLGVPAVLSGAFWAGLWGVAYVALLPRQAARGALLPAALFCATLPLLVSMFVVASLRGAPLAFGGNVATIGRVALIYAVWGVGLGLLLRLLGRGRA